MAEPLAIIGLVSSIITFLDFSSKLVSIAKRIRDNPHEPAPEAEKLREFKQRVRQLKDAFECDQGNEYIPQGIQDILTTADECETVAEDMDNILKRLRPKDKTASRTIEAGLIAIQAMWKRKSIESLQERLERLDVRLRGAVNQVLQHNEHTAIMGEIQMLKRLHLSMAVDYDDLLDNYESQILRLTSPEVSEALNTDQLHRLNEQLEAFEKECKARRHTARVLKRLDFPEIRRRWNKVQRTEENTNTWIFDSAKTNFLDWSESGNGIFWITGKAGSGKSTLMKFVSDHQITRKALECWANGYTLHVTSYYFWNQGSPLQKSLKGLFRTILFNILKTTPPNVTRVCPTLPEGDWTEEELMEMLQKLTKLDNVKAKFCFFIDGLDEFSGEETDLCDVISFFSDYLHVKLCVSSRPRIIFDEAFMTQREGLNISDFTADDMKHYVRKRLKTPMFEKLQKQPGGTDEYKKITTKIAKTSKGVWLWVYLVTHDLVRAVKGGEKIDALHTILDEFPEELEEYFKYIIKGVKKPFREEMAQIFLITIDEVQPLPVFIFSLLQREAKNAHYAVEAPIEPLDIKSIEADDLGMKSLLHNRCRDLLVVEDGSHPVVLSHPVDFLHRTVRDFLRDCYYDELKRQLKRDFDPLVSLCNMMLFLVKSLPAVDAKKSESITQWFQIIDELLYYASEIEKRDPSQAVLDHVFAVLNELDNVNKKHHAQNSGNHWASIRDPPRTRGYDEYREGGKCNFLALTIQARLTKYVAASINRDPSKLRKVGRPLLDYAVRPRRVTALIMPYHSQRDEAGIDIEMVTLLLDLKASPNEPVHLNEDSSVWVLFLLSIYESSQRDQVSVVTKQVWYSVCELFIRHGAELNCQLERDRILSIEMVLEAVFNADKASALQRLMAEERVKRRNNSWWALPPLPDSVRIWFKA